MVYVALALSGLIAIVGAFGVVSPGRLMGVIGRVQTPVGLVLAAGLRISLGVALFNAAPDSEAPGLIRIFGMLSFVAGVVTLFLGLERAGRLADWWSAKPDGLLRAWSAVALTLGLYLVWAVAP